MHPVWGGGGVTSFSKLVKVGILPRNSKTRSLRKKYMLVVENVRDLATRGSV